MRGAVFLDRDGVLNAVNFEDGRAVAPRTVADLRITSGAAADLARLKRSGYLVVVVTNQPDVARGTARRRDVDALNAALAERLPIDATYCCFHDTSDGCDCRKPRPGMLLAAARDLGIDLAQSWLVGDRWVDIDAASAAGVRSILLETPYSWQATSEGPSPADLSPMLSVRSLTEAVERIESAAGEP